ncbi:MAG: TRAP transporter small permease [Stappiaceae bacterium]
MIKSVLERLRRSAIAVAIGANAIGTAVILLLVVMMNTDVVARGVFHAPLLGVVELVIFSLVMIVFLQLPNVVRSNRLTRSDGFLVVLERRHLKLSHILSRLIDGLAGLFMALIAWTMWPEFQESIHTCHFFSQPEFGPPPTGDVLEDLREAFSRCDYFGTPGIFTAPWWPAKLAICFGVTLCSLIFFLNALLGFRGEQKLQLVDQP